jgi:hypothetical protein
MTTFTELVAAVVVQSSTLALSHFGVTLQPTQIDRPPPAPAAAERVIARTPSPLRPVARLTPAMKLTSCPEHRRASPIVKT